MGAVQLCCALLVASGVTCARTRSGKTFADCTAFLRALLQSTLWVGLKVVHLLHAHGATHAPKHLGPWMASLELSCAGRLDWVPTHASWLDQVEIIFRTGHRDVLTPHEFPSTLALEKQLTP